MNLKRVTFSSYVSHIRLEQICQVASTGVGFLDTLLSKNFFPLIYADHRCLAACHAQNWPHNLRSYTLSRRRRCHHGSSAAEAPLNSAAMTLFSFDNPTDLNSVERDFGFKPTSFTTYLQEHGI